MKKKEQSTEIEDLRKELSRLKKENVVLTCKLDKPRENSKNGTRWYLQAESRKSSQPKTV